MIRIVTLAGILAASVYTANAQEISGNPEAGRAYAREVCSPCHALTAEQGVQRIFAVAPDFPGDCQHTRNDRDRASCLLADAPPEDAKPDPRAGAIGRRDRLPAQPARPPVTASTTLSLTGCRSSTRSRAAKTVVPMAGRSIWANRAAPRVAGENLVSGASRCSRPNHRSPLASATDPASHHADAIGSA